MPKYAIFYNKILDQKTCEDIKRLTQAAELREPDEFEKYLDDFENVFQFVYCDNNQRAKVYVLDEPKKIGDAKFSISNSLGCD